MRQFLFPSYQNQETHQWKKEITQCGYPFCNTALWEDVTRNCTMVVYHLLRSVHSVGKLFAKFRTGDFRPGIAFTICTNQFHLPENGREGLKLVSKMALKKWNTNFCLEYSIRKNRTTFSDVPLLLEIFCWEDPKKSCQCFIYFPTGIPEKFL